MLFDAMTLKDASDLYDKIQASHINMNLKFDMLDDIVYNTDNFERDYGSPRLKVKYYVEIVNCEDCSDYSIQSKWFDTPQQAREWFDTNIDYLGENHDAYIMYAEWDETSDSYDDIEQFEQLFKRS